MKHLLNSLTENEKNSIREQHTGGMKVMTENFSKLVNTKSGDVRTLVEQPVEEPTPPQPLPQQPVVKPDTPIPQPTPNSGANPLKRLTGSGTWLVKDGNIQFSDSNGTVVLGIRL
jgi:hypothetical protein